ncbi:tektin-3 [Latimeria chalumnae]|uniref:Tektin n=1 Tax=Latimeria chalumnae TaxID=7897 RepID=H3AL41_LATCH|nr:PREDICTED: tektin-5 [Latimeria chalumnae]|eukprot:XP_006007946.1 PREDICTED: tektin-5 [Latimeria chalumnae]
MELMGTTQNSSYQRLCNLGYTYTPNTSTMQDSYRSHMPAQPLTHSLTLPWRPSNMCKVATGLPALECLPRASTQIAPCIKMSFFTRHTPDEWYRSNFCHYKESDWSRRNAEKLRLGSFRLMDEKNEITRKVQTQCNRNIGERIVDINFWKSELNCELEKLIKETNNLLFTNKRVNKALMETEGPLQMAQECLYYREKRMGIDLVHDNVEKELLKEVSVIKCCQERLRRTKERTEAQLASNRAIQHMLEADIGDKYTALRIDDKCHRLRNTSDGISYFKGVETKDKTVSVPESWSKFSDDNILNSQSERSASAKLREEAEVLIHVTSQEMWNQFNDTNVAFTNRIAETTEARNNLQMHLSKVLQEIFQTDMTIERLKQAIREKEAPLKVAQTRLEERTKRPNIELCRDVPQYRLVGEVHTLGETIQHLRQRLQEAQDSLQRLVNTKSSLEYDLSVKVNSLFIDQDKCMGIRKVFPSTPRLVGFR